MGKSDEIPEGLGGIVPIQPRIPLNSGFDNNPFHLEHTLRSSLPPLYKIRLQVNSSTEGETNPNGDHFLTFLAVTDLDTLHNITNDSNLWIKGKGTVEPFQSIVPKHLISLEGELHSKLRRVAQQALNDQIQSGLLHVVRACAVGLERRVIQQAARSGEAITQLDERIRAFATDVISSAVFGEPWNALEDYTASNRKAHALSAAMHTLHFRVTDLNERGWREEPMCGGLDEILRPLHEFIQRSIGERRKCATKDMLSFWVTQHPALTDDELLNLCLTFLTMGHENVASAISWTLILLSEHPEQQQEIREEMMGFKGIDQVESVRELSHGLERTEAFFAETMRLYPSVPVLNRQAKRDTELCGFKVPKGSEVTLNLYAYHRHPSKWGDDAEVVDYHRHLKDSGNACPAIGAPGFAPFAGGGRTCIGRPLSNLQMKVILLTLLPKYVFTSTMTEATKPNNFVSFRPGKHSVNVTAYSAKL